MLKKGQIFFIITISIFLLAVTVSAAEVHLAWDPSSGNVTGYHIYYASSSGAYSNKYIDAGNVTDYVVTDLQPDSAYYFVVRAFNSAGESGNSNEVSWPNVTVNATPNTADNPGINVLFKVNIKPAPQKTVTYQWDFQDGSPSQKTTSSSINHKFNKAKKYQVRLSIIFVNGTSIKKTVNLKINDQKPAAPLINPTVKLTQS